MAHDFPNTTKNGQAGAALPRPGDSPSGARVSQRVRTQATQSELNSRLNASERWERSLALRALLRTPLMSADGSSEHFGLVRRHANWLREWISTNTGWRVDITAEYARLRKVPSDLEDATRPLRDGRSSQPFTRRRYVLLCLVLAALERSDRQTTLGKLAESVAALAGADEVLSGTSMVPDFKTAEERRDLVHAVRVLVELRVLVQQDGDEQAFLSARGDVLYKIRRPCLAAMISTTRSPSAVVSDSLPQRIRHLTEVTAPESEDARNQAARWAITRRLLDNSVVYRAELSTDEVGYLETQRPAIVRRIEDATGLVAEVRSEGVAMIDDRGDLSDLGIPEEGTNGHIALIVAEFLADAARQRPEQSVFVSEVAEHIAKARTRFGANWKRDAREEGSENALAHEAIERLCGLRLVSLVPGGVVPLPAIGRYRLGELRQQVGATALEASP